MKTVLNYVGSRYFKVYDEVERIIKTVKATKNDITYIEPFGGGFSLGLNLLDNGIIETAIYNDIDKRVANFWECLKAEPFKLINSIDSLITELSKEHGSTGFKNKIVEYEESKDKFKQAAGEYMRRKYSIRYKYIDFKPIQIRLDTFNYTETLLKASGLLQKVLILNRDYRELHEFNSDNCIWSFDPPFMVDSIRDYYRACEDGFDHDSFKKFSSDLSGVVIISYNKIKYIEELYNESDTLILDLDKRRGLKGGGSGEFLIVKNWCERECSI